MALLSNLFNTSKPRQFHYQPLYYDERKERLEKMKAEAAAAAGKNAEVGYAGLRRGFLTDRREKSKLKRVALEKASTFRFLMILIILLMILYFIMPEIFQALWRANG